MRYIWVPKEAKVLDLLDSRKVLVLKYECLHNKRLYFCPLNRVCGNKPMSRDGLLLHIQQAHFHPVTSASLAVSLSRDPEFVTSSISGSALRIDPELRLLVCLAQRRLMVPRNLTFHVKNCEHCQDIDLNAVWQDKELKKKVGNREIVLEVLAAWAEACEIVFAPYGSQIIQRAARCDFCANKLSRRGKQYSTRDYFCCIFRVGEWNETVHCPVPVNNNWNATLLNDSCEAVAMDFEELEGKAVQDEAQDSKKAAENGRDGDEDVEEDGRKGDEVPVDRREFELPVEKGREDAKVATYGAEPVVSPRHRALDPERVVVHEEQAMAASKAQRVVANQPVNSVSIPVVEPMRNIAVPVVEPTKDIAVPVVEPTKNVAVPVVEPTKNIAVPVVEPVNSAAVPVVEPKKSIAVPVAEPVNSAAVPVVEPKKSIAVPVAEVMESIIISDGESDDDDILVVVVKSVEKAIASEARAVGPVAQPVATSATESAQSIATSATESVLGAQPIAEPVAQPITESNAQSLDGEQIATTAELIANAEGEPIATAEVEPIDPAHEPIAPAHEPIAPHQVERNYEIVSKEIDAANHESPSVERNNEAISKEYQDAANPENSTGGDDSNGRVTENIHGDGLDYTNGVLEEPAATSANPENLNGEYESNDRIAENDINESDNTPDTNGALEEPTTNSPAPYHKYPNIFTGSQRCPWCVRRGYDKCIQPAYSINCQSCIKSRVKCGLSNSSQYTSPLRQDDRCTQCIKYSRECRKSGTSAACKSCVRNHLLCTFPKHLTASPTISPGPIPSPKAQTSNNLSPRARDLIDVRRFFECLADYFTVATLELHERIAYRYAHRTIHDEDTSEQNYSFVTDYRNPFNQGLTTVDSAVIVELCQRLSEASKAQARTPQFAKNFHNAHLLILQDYELLQRQEVDLLRDMSVALDDLTGMVYTLVYLCARAGCIQQRFNFGDLRYINGPYISRNVFIKNNRVRLVEGNVSIELPWAVSELLMRYLVVARPLQLLVAKRLGMGDRIDRCNGGFVWDIDFSEGKRVPRLMPKYLTSATGVEVRMSAIKSWHKECEDMTAEQWIQGELKFDDEWEKWVFEAWCGGESILER